MIKVKNILCIVLLCFLIYSFAGHKNKSQEYVYYLEKFHDTYRLADDYLKHFNPYKSHVDAEYEKMQKDMTVFYEKMQRYDDTLVNIKEYPSNDSNSK